MNSTATILEQLERLSGRMEMARQKVQTGQSLDLDHLEAEIQHVCAGIAELPEAERSAFRRPLTGLMSELDDLTHLLRHGLDQLGRQLADSSQRRQAVAAYGQPGTPPRGSGR